LTIFLWPANRPFDGCLIRQQLSPVCFCLLARTVALLLGLISRIPPQEQPVLGLGLLLLKLKLPSAVGQRGGRGVPLTVDDRQRHRKG